MDFWKTKRPNQPKRRGKGLIAGMGFFDKNRYARKDRNGFVQSEFLFQEGGFAE